MENLLLSAAVGVPSPFCILIIYRNRELFCNDFNDLNENHQKYLQNLILLRRTEPSHTKIEREVANKKQMPPTCQQKRFRAGLSY